MGRQTVHAATLQRAAAGMGSEKRLAKVLGVTEKQLRRWLAGAEYPPTHVYQKALDLLIGIGIH